jgi:hypothetical protein
MHCSQEAGGRKIGGDDRLLVTTPEGWPEAQKLRIEPPRATEGDDFTRCLVLADQPVLDPSVHTI